MKQTDREGGQTSVSSTSIVGCKEMMRDSQSEGWMEKETGNNVETKQEETERKNVLEREQASVSEVSTAGSAGREGSSGRQMWAHV